MNPEDIILTWRTPEFIKYSKDNSWYWAVGIIFASLVFVFLVLESFTGAILFGLIATMVIVYGAKDPKMINASITEDGVLLGGLFHDYEEDLRSFWINYQPGEVKELILRTNAAFHPHLHISIEDEDPNEIRKALIDFIPEVKIEESLMDIIARKLRF